MPRLIAAAAALLVALSLAPAEAQTYPDRPVRTIVPFPAGGLSDEVARIVAQRLGEVLGQSFVVENRPGASGTLGAGLVAKAAPDGITLLMTTGDFITTPGIMPPMPFSADKDLIPITMLADTPVVLVANAASGLHTVADIVAAAKASPSGLPYASPGVGTTNQLAAEGLAIATGIKLLHVPYRGGAPATAAAAAGDVPLASVAAAPIAGFLAAGKIRVVAVTTRKRASFAPDWPTLNEMGVDMDTALWVGLFAPAGTPAAIVGTLRAQTDKVLHEPAVVARLNNAGTDAAPVSGPAFLKRIADERAAFAEIIRKTGMHAPDQ